jgi:1,4-dihydroxy-2-naphthoate octaprenyltransferase
MRDIEGDAFSGVNTIPVMLGEQNTKTLLAALNLFIGLSVLIISIEYLSPIVTYLLAAGMIYAHLYIFSFDKVGQTDVLCDMVVDGQFTILGVMFYIGTKVMYGF